MLFLWHHTDSPGTQLQFSSVSLNMRLTGAVHVWMDLLKPFLSPGKNVSAVWQYYVHPSNFDDSVIVLHLLLDILKVRVNYICLQVLHKKHETWAE